MASLLDLPVPVMTFWVSKVSILGKKERETQHEKMVLGM
jgi:hypothetical protein